MDTVLNCFVEQSKEILKDNLVGIYLHGSAAMGCYNPAKSDIDLIIVVKDSIEDSVKRAFMVMVVELNENGPAKGIEMSIVKKVLVSHLFTLLPLSYIFLLHILIGTERILMIMFRK